MNNKTNNNTQLSTRYTPVIGLEIHVELTTKSKMFCGCSSEHFGAVPNTHTCPVCLGLPGALPVPNKQAIDDCLKMGMSLGCDINRFSYFERKNYFYPDLPKAFQLSQYAHPFNVKGELEIEVSGKKKTVRITRAHMEEDTGKIIHRKIDGKNVSLIDFNRSGVPLVEIVTEPDIESGEEARIFLTKLRQIIRYLGVSDADMEKGHMRLEPNISVRMPGEEGLPSYKVEVKNINSFKFVEKAINFEVKRHIEMLGRGETPVQETRGWDENRGVTFSQRVKEEAHDYRYFPEPDIPPIRIDEARIKNIKKELPELPDLTKRRLESEYGLSHYQSEILTREKETADFFEDVMHETKEHDVEGKEVANEIINSKIDVSSALPAAVIKRIVENKKTVKVDEEKLNEVVRKAIEDNPQAIQDYKSGKENAIMFLVGVVMREMKVRLDAKTVIDKLKEQAENA